jgi:transposase
MNPHPGPCSVLVMDNCKIHTSDEIHHLLKEEAGWFLQLSNISETNSYIGLKLVFLPLYSPDYNPIEMAFAIMKAYICHNNKESGITLLDQACAMISPEMAFSFF